MLRKPGTTKKQPKKTTKSTMDKRDQERRSRRAHIRGTGVKENER